MEELLQPPNECIIFFADATFQVAPKGFSQMLNICVDYHGKAVCIANVLMTAKPRKLYTEIFRTFKEVFHMFRPQEFITDYESAMVLGIKDNFPDVTMTGKQYVYFLEYLSLSTNKRH